MGFLDKDGLTHFWGKVLDALTGKQDNLEPDESITLDGNNISVSLPTKSVTQAEYNALNDEQKQADILYVVDEPPWIPAPLSIQEYDTEDGWHVRKWSDGYVELFTRFLWTGGFSGTTGGFIHASSTTFTYPIPLTELYALNAYVGSGRTGGAIWIATGPISINDRLVKTPVFYAIATDNNSTGFEVYITAKGRWK